MAGGWLRMRMEGDKQWLRKQLAAKEVAVKEVVKSCFAT